MKVLDNIIFNVYSPRCSGNTLEGCRQLSHLMADDTKNEVSSNVVPKIYRNVLEVTVAILEPGVAAILIYVW